MAVEPGKSNVADTDFDLRLQSTCYDRLAVDASPPRTFDPSRYPASYRMSSGYSVLFCVLGGIALGAGGLGAWYFGTGHEIKTPGQLWMLVSICLGFMLLGGVLIASTLRSGVTLRADAIVVQGLFSSQTLLRDQIAGRRVVPTQYVSTLEVVPRSSREKKLKIAMALRTDAAFEAWFTGLPDLDAAELAKSEADVTADPDLGFHSDDRKQRIAEAKKIARTLTIVTWAVFLWAFIFPKPYSLVVLILTCLPLVALLLLMRSRGIYQMEGRRNDARPSLAVAFLFPGMALALRTLQDFHLIRWLPILYVGVPCAAMLCWVVFNADHGIQKRRWSVLPIFLFGSFYTCAAIAEGNTLLDRAPAERFQTAVMNKRISSGRHTTYYLRLEPWGGQSMPSDVSVPRSLYAATTRGESVCVYLRPGAFQLPWYLVDRCE